MRQPNGSGRGTVRTALGMRCNDEVWAVALPLFASGGTCLKRTSRLRSARDSEGPDVPSTGDLDDVARQGRLVRILEIGSPTYLRASPTEPPLGFLTCNKAGLPRWAERLQPYEQTSETEHELDSPALDSLLQLPPSGPQSTVLLDGQPRSRPLSPMSSLKERVCQGRLAVGKSDLRAWWRRTALAVRRGDGGLRAWRVDSQGRRSGQEPGARRGDLEVGGVSGSVRCSTTISKRSAPAPWSCRVPLRVRRRDVRQGPRRRDRVPSVAPASGLVDTFAHSAPSALKSEWTPASASTDDPLCIAQSEMLVTNPT